MSDADHPRPPNLNPALYLGHLLARLEATGALPQLIAAAAKKGVGLEVLLVGFLLFQNDRIEVGLPSSDLKPQDLEAASNHSRFTFSSPLFTSLPTAAMMTSRISAAARPCALSAVCVRQGPQPPFTQPHPRALPPHQDDSAIQNKLKALYPRYENTISLAEAKFDKSKTGCELMVRP